MRLEDHPRLMPRRVALLALLVALVALLPIASPASAQTQGTISIISITPSINDVQFTVKTTNATVFGDFFTRYRENGTAQWINGPVKRIGLSGSDDFDVNIQSLRSATQYDLEVSLDTSYPPGGGTASNTFTTLAPPSEVTGVSVGSLTRTTVQVTVTTANAAGSTVYLQHRQQSASWEVANRVSLTVPSGGTATRALTGLTAGTSYDVRASFDSSFPAGGTASGTFTTEAPVVPGAPRNVTVTDQKDGTLRVQWDPPASNGGSELTDYKVEFYSVDRPEFVRVQQQSVIFQRNYEIPRARLVIGIQHNVTVTARNSVGYGAPSPEASATPTSTPGAPTIVSTSSTTDSITLNWSAPSDNGGLTITSYEVEWTDESDESNQTTVNGITHTITDLEEASEYSVRVRAVNDNGGGDWSAISAVYTEEDVKLEAPGPPRNVTATDSDDGSLAVRWVAPESDGGADITAYTVYWKLSAAAAYDGTHSINNPSPPLEYTIPASSLAGGMQYDVKVTATNSEGDSGDSNVASATPIDTPGAPTVNATSITTDSIALSWNVPDAGGGTITGYEVHWLQSDEFFDFDDADGTATTTATTYTITSLLDGELYSVRVRAVNGRGQGAWGYLRAISTEVGRPGVPTITSVTPGDGKLTVSWTAPTDGGSVSGYKVQWKSGSQEFGASHEEDDVPSGTSHTITGLTNGTTYDVRVLAYNDSYLGEPSNTMSDTPAAATPVVDTPGAPTNVRVVRPGLDGPGHGAGILVLHWNAPSDTGASAITGYEVEWANNALFNPLLGTKTLGADSSFTDIQDLPPNIDYYLQVRASNGSGAGPWSTSVSAQTAARPPAPTITSVVPGDGSLTVSWTLPDFEGLLVSQTLCYRMESDNPFPTQEEVFSGRPCPRSKVPAEGATSFTIDGLTNGTEYQVRMKIRTLVDFSPLSDIVNGTPVLPSVVPGAPTLDSVTPGDGKLTVSWTAPTDGGPVTGYKVQWKSDSQEFDTSQGDDVTSGTSHTITGLTNDTSYDVQVLAYNQIGNGTPSSTRSATPVAAAPVPGAPEIINVTIISHATTNSTLTFRVIVENANDTTIYLRYGVGDPPSQWTHLNGTASDRNTEVTLTGLTASTTYTVQFSLDNSFPADASKSRTLTTPAGTTPGAPIITGITAGDGTLTVNWDAPKDTGGLTIISYKVQWRTENQTFVVGRQNTETGTTSTITGLTNGTTYYVRVIAVNSVGDGTPSNEMSDTPDGAMPVVVAPGAPILDSVAPGDGQLTVSWSAPSGGGSVIGYKVQWRTESQTFDENQQETTTGTTFTITGLTNGTTYYVRVIAVNSVGDGTPSNEMSDTPDGAAPVVEAPGAPTITRITPGNGTLTVSWTAPTSGGTVTGYKVQWRTESQTFDENQQETTTGTTFTITGLTNGTIYHVQVIAYNDAGDDSTPSNTMSGTPAAAAPVVEAPGAPTITRITPGNGTLTVSWTAPTSGGTVTGYKVQWRTESQTFDENQQETTTGTTFDIMLLTNGTIYHVQVIAFNDAVDGPPSNEMSATPGALADMPTGLGLARSGHGELTATWGAPSQVGGSSIMGYKVYWRIDASALTWPWPVYIDAADVGPEVFTYTITGLTNERVYNVAVVAINLVGEGAPAFAFDTPFARPTKPVITSVVANADPLSITVNWNESSGRNPVAYKVEWKVSTVESWDQAHSNQIDISAWAETLTYTITTDLTDNASHDVRVIARSNREDSEPSDPMSTTPSSAPGEPTLTGVTPGDGTLAVTWTAPTSNPTPALYTVQWKTVGESFGANEENEETVNHPATSHTITGLENGTPYDVQVIASSNTGDSAPSNSMSGTPSTTPGQPSVTVQLGSQPGSLLVTWSEPDTGGAAISEYIVQWRTSLQQYSETERIAREITGTSHTFNVADPTAEYFVQVTAVNENGPGAPSLEASVFASTVPGEPNLTSVVIQGDITPANNTLVVSWSAPDDGGAQITGYKVQWKSGAQEYNEGDRQLVVTAPTLTAEITGLDGAASYDVRVIADNGRGPSAPSGQQTTIIPGAPNPPTGLTATRDSTDRGGKLTLEWTAPESDQQLRPVSGYIVRWKSDGEDYDPAQQAQTNDVSFSLGGLVNGTLYYVQVYAENDVDESAPSNEASETPGAPPGPPVLHAASTDFDIRVAWESPEDIGGFSITSFIVQWKSDTQGEEYSPDRLVIIQDVDVPDALVHEIRVVRNDIYSIRVIAVNDMGNGEPSEVTVRAAIAVGASIGPITVPLDTTTQTSATVTVRIENTDGTDRTVYLRYRPAETAPGGQWTRVSENTTEDSVDFTVSSLTANTEYEVQASLAQDFPVDARSVSRFFTASTTPGVPTGVTAAPVTDAPGQARLRVSWVAADDGGSAITGYTIEWTPQDGQTQQATVGGQTLAYTIENLTIGQAYSVSVTAANEHGAGSASTPTVGVPTTVPGAPGSVSVQTGGDGELVVAWQEPSVLGGLSVTGYTVQWRSGNEEFGPQRQASVNASTATYTIRGLASGVQHVIRVMALNDNGAGVPSVSATGTPVAVAGVPTNLSVTHGDETLTLQWQPPSGAAGATVVQYIVQWTESGGSFGAPEQQATVSSLTLTYTIQNLQNGTAYDVQVIAVNTSGPSEPASATGTPSTVPGAPAITDIIAGSGELTVSWSAPDDNGGADISDYVVQWKLANESFGPATPEATVSGETLTYTISNLQTGTPYDVHVIAVNTNGRGTPSETANGVPVEQALPTISGVSVAPQSITMTGATITVSIANTDGNNRAVHLRHRTAPSGQWGSADPIDTAESSVEFTLGGLVENTEYEVQASLDSTFPSDGSRSVLFSTTSTGGTVPGAPAITSVAAADGRLTVDWTASTDDGGAGISGYIVQWKSGDEEFGAEREAAVGAQTLTYTILNLTNDTAYEMRVIAENVHGRGNGSVVESGTPSPAAMPFIFGIVVETGSITESEATIGVGIENADGSIQTVHLRYRIAPSGQWGSADPIDTMTAGAEFTLTGLSANTEYEVQASLDGSFPAEARRDATFVTLASARAESGAPTITEVIPDDGELVVTWSTPETAEGTEVTSYDLRYIRSDATDKADANWMVVNDITGTPDSSTPEPTPEPSNPCVTHLGTLTADVTTDGEWTDECDSASRVGMYARFFTFTLEQDAEVQIDLTSDEDTYLFLLLGAGRDGEEEAQNDDIVSGVLDSRIGPVTLNAGTYTIESTTYYAGTIGAFTLTITVPEAAAVAPPPPAPPVMPVLRYILADLDNGVEYDVQVRAVSEASNGEWSETATGTPAIVDPCVTDLGTLTADVTTDGEWTDECDSASRVGMYARFFTFTLEQDTEVQIDLTSDEDTYLFLLLGAGRDGEEEAQNDDIVSGVLDSRIGPVTLNAGTYTIESTTYDAGTTGAFTLTISGQQVAVPEPTPPEPIGPDSCVTDLGTLTADVTTEGEWTDECDSASRVGGYARFFTFTLEQDTEVQIDLTSEEDTYLFLLLGAGRDGEEEAQNDDIVSGVLDSRIGPVTLNAGTYTIESTTYDAGTTGAFTLTISGQQVAVPEPTPPEPIGPDSCVTDLGTLTADVTTEGEWTDECDSASRIGMYARFFTFTLEQDTEVQIDLTSEEDTYLFLLLGAGRDGQEEAQNDDIVSGVLDSRIGPVTLNAGTYTIESTTYDAGTTGAFTLTISGQQVAVPEPTPPEPIGPDSCVTDLGTLTADVTTEGEWTDECDSASRIGMYARFFTFTLEQDTEVQIDLTSEEDTYLFLLLGAGRDGQEEAQNDDIVSGVLDSRIGPITLNAGTYTIESTTYDAGTTGAFTLTISDLLEVSGN